MAQTKRPSMLPRRHRGNHGRAVEILARQLQLLDQELYGEKLTPQSGGHQVAVAFVDALTDHVLEAVYKALDDHDVDVKTDLLTRIEADLRRQEKRPAPGPGRYHKRGGK